MSDDKNAHQVCLEWCHILWDDPEATMNGLSLAEWADRIAGCATGEGAVVVRVSGRASPRGFLSRLRRPRPRRDEAGSICDPRGFPHTIPLSPQALALANMALHLRGPLFPGAGLNLFRHYAFDAVLSTLGLIPYRVLSAVGTLLYDRGRADLDRAFDGQLTPDDAKANAWIKLSKEGAKGLFHRGLPPGWGWAMREARGAEREEMQFVLERLSEHLLLPPPHTPHAGDFCAAYERVVTSVPPPRPGPPRAGHRRDEEIEQLAEHLVVCAHCGGVNRLIENGLIERGRRTTTATEPVLYVPAYFPSGETGPSTETDGART